MKGFVRRRSGPTCLAKRKAKVLKTKEGERRRRNGQDSSRKFRISTNMQYCGKMRLVAMHDDGLENESAKYFAYSA